MKNPCCEIQIEALDVMSRSMTVPPRPFVTRLQLMLQHCLLEVDADDKVEILISNLDLQELRRSVHNNVATDLIGARPKFLSAPMKVDRLLTPDGAQLLVNGQVVEFIQLEVKL